MEEKYLTVNYPFEKILDKTADSTEFHIETPWIDEDDFWKEAEVEVLVNDTDPFLRVIKTDYKNGFKTIIIENDYKYYVKTNWALDLIEGNTYLPRIQ
ncbi:hypothetical protein [Staphylococcus haemolyticus]|uniref:hypothetical protein n=1 Tax=Staphylococcus haemolyticus TaxID=1283 RepID=UPI001C1EBE86|nr:hypothetical protein [Staphylococcus haemolyticus]MBU6948696.1 hypothetical protein [Staphylococcus haemolyticus]MBU7211527.1 hypothetical protein [Staphylococcus haemolyticus]